MADVSTSSAFPPGYLEARTGNDIIAATTVILIITTLFLGLRFYARTLTTASRSWDDFLLIPAYILFLGLTVICYVAVTTAYAGWHVAAVAKVDPSGITRFAFLQYLLEWFYLLSGILSRISVVLLYLRIFNNKTARICCWIVIGFLIAYTVSTLVGANLQCQPLAFAWNRNIKGGHCFDVLAFVRWTTIPSVIADVAILCLPMRTIWMLQASAKRKAGIAIVCLTGAIGLVSSCIRVWIFFALGDMIESDPTWVATPLLIQTVVETGTYLCAACLIGFRPLYKGLPKWVRKNILRSNGTYGGSSNFSSSHPASRKDINKIELNDIGKSQHLRPNTRGTNSMEEMVHSGEDVERDNCSRRHQDVGVAAAESEPQPVRLNRYGNYVYE